MKLQEASRKEIRRITLGTLVCDGILIAGLFLLSQFGIGSFDLTRILLGAVCGSMIAVLNFTLLCLTVQGAVGTASKQQMKAKFQLSYNLRLGLQAAWVVVCYVVPQIHFIAGVAPILFPNLVIFWLQSRGKLVEPGQVSSSSAPSSQEEPEDRLESFEV